MSAPLKPILLVEDNPLDLELTLSAFEKCKLGNDVTVARDGAEALDYLFLEEERPLHEMPVVIILDIKLPKLDGLEVLEKIRQHPKTRYIPVVMLTSSREEEDLVRSYKLGVNAFVVKPVGYKEFFAAIYELGMFWGVFNEPPPGFRKRG
ncbi:response regulator [Telmatospirillum sp. J64-1]|uniref:response regulator n=1 Tax=Telmatospirillum sp. J64-1 TaxID=2502183 RepID=UPI00115E3858|nr:response regulator [Telmatospirillum sp. J64-1]